MHVIVGDGGLSHGHVALDGGGVYLFEQASTGGHDAAAHAPALAVRKSKHPDPGSGGPESECGAATPDAPGAGADADLTADGGAAEFEEVVARASHRRRARGAGSRGTGEDPEGPAVRAAQLGAGAGRPGQPNGAAAGHGDGDTAGDAGGGGPEPQPARARRWLDRGIAPDPQSCTVFLDLDDNFYKRHGGTGSAAKRTQAAIAYATQIFTIAAAAFKQNFGAVANLRLAGAKVWSDSSNEFYTGGSINQRAPKACLKRYAPSAVHLHPNGGQFDFVRLPARTHI